MIMDLALVMVAVALTLVMLAVLVMMAQVMLAVLVLLVLVAALVPTAKVSISNMCQYRTALVQQPLYHVHAARYDHHDHVRAALDLEQLEQRLAPALI